MSSTPSKSTPSKRVKDLLARSLRVLLVAAVAGCLSPAAGFAAQVEDVAFGPSARALGDMEPSLRRRLHEAFALASRTVSSVESCRAMFHQLDHPAVLSLKHTLYVSASGLQERKICRRGVSAFTEVGSRVTYLCRGFRRLAPPRAAAALVHEALHLAGLQEAPIHPGAPSSREINHQVAASCRL